MKIKATKKMAHELNKRIPENSSIYSFMAWSRIPNTLDSWDDIDYDSNGDIITKIIKVIYKPECYAMDGELTTSELVKIFKRSGANTVNEYASAVLEAVEI